MRNLRKVIPQTLLKDKRRLKGLDPQVIQELKIKLQKTLDNHYSTHFSQELKFFERELILNKHKGFLCGYHDDDYSASEYLLMRIEERNPNGIILTEFSRDDFLFYKNGSAIYETPPQIDKVTEESILGRQMLLKFFQNDFKHNLKYYKDFGDYTISEMDNIYRRKILNMNLSLSFWACYKDDIKLILAAPQKLLVIEDLCVSLELKDLKNIFNETIKNFVDFTKEHLFEPALNIKEFYINLKDVTKEKFSQILYEKRCIYSASVIRKIHKLYNNNIIAVDNDLVRNVFRHWYSKDNFSVDEYNPDFTKIYRDDEFYNNLENIDSNEESLKIFLEKIVILSHILDREFRNYVDNNVNAIKGLFGKKFEKYEDDYILRLYKQINSYYAKILETLFYNDVKRVVEIGGTFGRLHMKTYSDEIKKLEEDKKYSFLVDKSKKLNELKYIFKLLLSQISLNIIKKEKEGKDMGIIKHELKKLFSGNRSKENLKLYSELLVEANTQLGLIKFPESYKENFSEIIKTVSYNELKNFIGEDPITKFENAQISINNQMKGVESMNIKEGSEPMMNPNLIKKQPKILDLPNILINSKLRDLLNRNSELKIDPNLIKDNSKMMSFINSEYENLKRTDESLTEVSEVMIFGQGTENEKRILYKDIREKSIDELKAMGFEEINTVEMKVDEQGNFRTKSEGMPAELVQKLDEDFKLSDQLDEFSELYDNTNRDKDYNKQLKKLAEIVADQDDKRINKIIKALELGIEINDPLYYTMIVMKKEWMQKRVNYLKKHFSGDKNINMRDLERVTYEKHYELAGKYHPDNDIDNEAFLSMETPESKKYTKMVRKKFTENEDIKYLNNYEQSRIMDEDNAHEMIDFRTFVNDRIKEIKRDDIGKKNYDLDRGIEIPEDKNIDNYVPGSTRKKKSKTMRKL